MTRRALAGAAAVLLTLMAFGRLLSGGGPLTSQPGLEGPASSAFTTGPSGVAAWSELLERHGHSVRRVTDGLDIARPPAAATYVQLDPGGADAVQATALREFVRDGGRAVVAGDEDWIGLVLEQDVAYLHAPAGTAHAVVSVAETSGVREVRRPSGPTIADPGPALPVLTDGAGAVAVVTAIGSGRLVVVADSGVFANYALDEADNAAFALAVVGEPGREVWFDEAVHGFAPAGLGAIPGRWRVAAVLLTFAALVWMWTRSARIGPPSQAERDLGPDRREYIDSMATALRRTKREDEALARMRALVAERVSTEHRPGTAAWREAAERAGLTDAEIGSVTGRGDVEDLGRALARVGTGR